MADLLYDRLATLSKNPAFQTTGSLRRQKPPEVTLHYLSSLSSLSLGSLEDEEPRQLLQASHSLLLSLQALSKRSHKAVIDSATFHSTLSGSLPVVASSVADLRKAITRLDGEVVRFSTNYSKLSDNDTLKRRKRAQLLVSNVERLVDVMELPALLSSTASAGAQPAIQNNYSSALELNSHIRRLHGLYSHSPLVGSVSVQAEDAMRAMVANLIASLRVPGLKLAAALRTISWLRRVMADLDLADDHETVAQDRGLAGLFLVCRLTTLMGMLHALGPLRDLADQETTRQKTVGSAKVWSGGQQSERYLKRYIEIFREQSFAIVSMFRSIFPPTLPSAETESDPLRYQPSPMSTFTMQLVDMLTDTLQLYLPNVRDQASRDSLLTQVLYCAGSLGRLGGDFSDVLAGIPLGPAGTKSEEEWPEVVKRHRLLAGRLESMVGGKDTQALEK